MEVGLIADTHDNEELLKRAFTLFEVYGVDQILHLGDMGSPDYARLYLEKAPQNTLLIRGNHDAEWDQFPRHTNEQGFEIEYLSGPASKKIEGRSIGLYHGEDSEITKNMIDSQEYDFVLTAHTHHPKLEKIGNTWHIKPGHFKVPTHGTGDFDYPTVAVLDFRGRGTAKIFWMEESYPAIIMREKLFE